MPAVLVVDDDPTVSDVVRSYLERAGYSVALAADGPSAVEAVLASPPDLVVLDVMLPGFDGVEVCRRLRETTQVPVIMLTALDAEVDRVTGLEVGADDYVTKPFSPRELVLRVQSVLRRSGPDPAPAGEVAPLVDGDLEVDVAGRRALLAGRPLSLTAREFDLLAHLLVHPGVAFTREQLLHDVWHWDFGDLSTVTVHVRRLRAKVEPDPARPQRLVTVWGTGYRWDVVGTPAPAPLEVGAVDR